MSKLIIVDYSRMKKAAEFMSRYASVGQNARLTGNVALELMMQDYLEGALADIQQSFNQKLCPPKKK